MFIAELHLKNWLRFRGEHVVKLSPGTWAITCEWEHDKERSNFGGKTSVLEAIEFALYGRHRKRTEDAWITNGEDEGSVKLVLSNGRTIERKRTRGSPTELEVTNPGGGGHNRHLPGYTRGDAGQDTIRQIVGLDADEFRATDFIQQKKAARFVTDAGDRTEILSSWFGLDKLQEATKAAQAAARQAAQSELDHRNRAEWMLKALDLTGTPDWQAIDDELAAHAHDVEVAKKVVKEAEAEYTSTLQRQHEATSLADRGVQKQQLLEDARIAKMELDGFGSRIVLENDVKSAEELLATAQAAAQRIVDEIGVHAHRSLKGFDGLCPVMNKACPAHAQVDAATRGKEVDPEKIRARDEAQKKTILAKQFLKAKRDKLEEGKALAVHIKDLKERASKLPDFAPIDTAALKDAVSTKTHLREVANATLREAETKHDRAKRVCEKFPEWEMLIKKADECAHTKLLQQAAAAVFKQAQRAVASSALDTIEARANAAMSEAEIPLTVSLSWERAGKELAKECEKCGSAFGSSKKERQCGYCGAERGPNIIRKLEVDLSDVSGAPEDLAGITLQLAAAGWLRARRGGQWAVALLDEPYASLDRALRRRLSTHVTRLVMLSGFEQAFVISHAPETAAACEHRLLVKAGAISSSLEVES